ncbi:MAG: hypothetical protein H7Y13_10260 [Sphingobacteriaceae bacterium]|nr:hypothetical protein [Sphingobacteriaceae bacterium]
MPNIKLSYLYRDAGNYKSFGEAIFANPADIPLEEILPTLQSKMIDRQWFYAKDWGLRDLHFDHWNEELDHGFHEFESLEYCHDPSTSRLSLDSFIESVKRTNWIY